MSLESAEKFAWIWKSAHMTPVVSTLRTSETGTSVVLSASAFTVWSKSSYSYPRDTITRWDPGGTARVATPFVGNT